MRSKKKAQGFSVLEMLVAMSITIGLTGTLFYFFNQSQGAYVVESARVEMNQNFRAALDLMARDIQAAGAGIPMFLGPIAGKNGGGTNANPSLNPPDAILVLYGNSTVSPVAVKTGTHPAPTSATSTIYTDIPSSTLGAGNYILYSVAQPQMRTADISDHARFSLFSVSSSDIVDLTSGSTVIGKQITPTPFSVTPASDASYWAHTLSFPNSNSLRIVPLDEVIEYSIDTNTNELLRNRNRSGWVPVARNIFNLQIRYMIESYDATTDSFTTSWVDEVNQASDNNRAMIRGVELTIFGRTQMAGDGDKQGQRAITQTIEVTPRNLVLPGFAPNR